MTEPAPGPGAASAAPLAPGAPRPRWPPWAVALVVSAPVVVALVAMTREPSYPVGDFAHMIFRTSQVGTVDTPLTGAYSTKGWAHPGPLLFWLAAPFYRLSGGDPRSVEWATATIDVVCIVAVLQVAWRRGGLALLGAAGVLVALLVHGVSAEHLVIFWNPFVPLLPFLLTIVLVWDAGLGRWRSAALAVIPASVAVQGHLAFVVLVGALAVWLAAWARWGGSVVRPPSGPVGGDLAAPAETAEPRAHGLMRRIGGAAPRWLWVVVVVMWVGPVLDALVGERNPVRIARSFTDSSVAVGPWRAIGMVGRYVRPDGPWIGGAEPIGLDMSLAGSGPVPFLAALGALGWCVRAGRRRRLPDVVALATLSLTLLVVSVPATAQIVLPVFTYLTQWLMVVGGLVWFTVAWTAWRLVEPRLRLDVPVNRRVASAGGVAVLAVAVAISVPAAIGAERPASLESTAVVALGPELEANVPRDARLRVEMRGDYTARATAGVVYWLIDRDYDVVTGDGARGLKWGRVHRLDGDDHYDLVLTVALNRAVDECEREPSVRRLAAYDGLTADERAWLAAVRFRRLGGADAVTPGEVERGRVLATRDLRLAVFAGPDVCGARQRVDFGEPNSGWLVPAVVAGLAGAGAVAAGVVLLRRRRGAGAPPVGR